MEKLKRETVTYPNHAERKNLRKFKGNIWIYKNLNFCMMKTNKTKIKTYLNIIMRATRQWDWGLGRRAAGHLEGACVQGGAAIKGQLQLLQRRLQVDKDLGVGTVKDRVWGPRVGEGQRSHLR